MNNISIVEVHLAKREVGRIALTPEGVSAFEYNDDFIANGFSISPFFLPLRKGLFIAKSTPFRGGFGVFDDSLPDGWGSLLLDRFLKEKGIDPYSLSLLQRYSLIGATGRGALEYVPDLHLNESNKSIGLRELAEESERILMSREGVVSVGELFQYGGSSGGARPKVFFRIQGKEWMVKFKSASDPDNIGEIEYQYSLLAKECGLVIVETCLFDSKYFGVERFDRSIDGKVHTVSAAGLLHADFRIPSLDYSLLLKVCLSLTKDMQQVLQLFRLMVFNILISNRDDHAKNFSFQFKGGNWKLSPAYDILPSSGFNGFHTTTINGKGDPILADVLILAEEVGITRMKAKELVEELSTIIWGKKMGRYRLI